jgi:hypothetical protein
MKKDRALRLAKIEAARKARDGETGWEFWTVEDGMATNEKTGQKLTEEELSALPTAKSRFITIYDEGEQDHEALICRTTG